MSTSFEPDANATLWYDRFAELLGCSSRPGAIAAAIEQLRSEVERAQRAIPEHRRRATDGLIELMRSTAVNCGPDSSCAVAGWLQTLEEQSRKAADG